MLGNLRRCCGRRLSLVTATGIAVLSAICVDALVVVQTPENTVLRGVYTREQAKRGDEQYMKACAACHLADLSGEHTMPALAGDGFIQNYDGHNVADLFERIRTTMPQNAIGSLSDEMYLDIVAFLLQANRFPSGPAPLPTEIDELKKIVIRKRGTP